MPIQVTHNGQTVTLPYDHNLSARMAAVDVAPECSISLVSSGKFTGRYMVKTPEGKRIGTYKTRVKAENAAEGFNAGYRRRAALEALMLGIVK